MRRRSSRDEAQQLPGAEGAGAPIAEELIAEELRLHLEGRAEELAAAGWQVDEARREAQRRFGDQDATLRACLRYDRQRARSARRRTMFDWLRFEVRTAARALARRPVFSVTVVLTLALGIGASTAMWSVVEAVLLRPLPFRDAERLVFVWQEDRLTGTTREAASTPDFDDFELRSRTLAELAAFQEGRADQTHLLLPGKEPERVEVVLATHDLLDVLGVEPLVGRSFTAAEDVPGGPPVAVLAEPLWRRAFGARDAVVGETLRLDEDLFTIVGVVPSGLEVPSADAEVWLPMRSQPAGNTPRYNHGTVVVGRLAGGASVAGAAEEIAAIAADLEREYPENAGRGATVEPLREVLRGDLRGSLLLLSWASLLLLLLACTNAANLLLARGAARGRETAISAALGARGGRLAGRFLVEAALLAGAAAVGGLAFARGLLGALLDLAPPGVSRLAPPGLRPSVLFFAIVVATLVTVVFALVPVLQARRLAPGGTLPDALRGGRSDGGAGRARLGVRRALVVVQLAFALMLLYGAGLMLQSLRKLHAVDPGFDTASVLRVDYQLPLSRYPRGFERFPHWSEVIGFNDQLLARAAALPGVESAALTLDHPLDAGFTNSFVIAGREQESAEQGELTTRVVSSGYFATNRVELRSGRLFGTQDVAGSPMVLLLNEEAVRRYFPEGSPLGARVRFWGIEREVVGVVENERFHGLDRPAPPTMYAPIAQNPPLGETTLMLRTAAAPESLLGPLREIVRELDPAVALYGASTMADTLAGSLRRRTFTARLLGLFAGVALALAVLGVYGVLSYLVEQRRREVGIRMALGASRSRVVSMVFGEGIALAAVGTVLGMAGALGFAALLESLVFEVSPRSAASGALAASALLLAAALASFVPAARATRVDPAATLGSD